MIFLHGIWLQIQLYLHRIVFDWGRGRERERERERERGREIVTHILQRM